MGIRLTRTLKALYSHLYSHHHHFLLIIIMSISSSRSSSVVIVSMARTPIAKFRTGSLSKMTAPQLGSVAIRGALHKIFSLDGNQNHDPPIKVREVYMGNVVSAGIGQAPARQAVMGVVAQCGQLLSPSTICTTVNKVCASGMKAVMLATQTLQLAGNSSTGPGGWAMIAGGMESMSNIPHYLPGSRHGFALGNAQLVDGVIHDGLWDVYNNQVSIYTVGKNGFFLFACACFVFRNRLSRHLYLVPSVSVLIFALFFSNKNKFVVIIVHYLAHGHVCREMCQGLQH
jgi:Thiolase, N-terminal domain